MLKMPPITPMKMIHSGTPAPRGDQERFKEIVQHTNYNAENCGEYRPNQFPITNVLS
jgi:hypothetical protein